MYKRPKAKGGDFYASEKNVTIFSKTRWLNILSTKQSFLIFEEYIDRIFSVAQTIALYLKPIKNGDELKVG